MIFRHKRTGIVVQNASVTADIHGEHIQYTGAFCIEQKIPLHISKDDCERLYTESEMESIVNEKIKKLENEIIELKNKKQQYEQIEIPQYLADIIEYYKQTFHFNTEKVVTLILQISKLKNMDNVTQDTFQIKEYLQKNENGLLNIITAIINGYTIKKEPTDILRDNIFFVIGDGTKVSKIMELINKFNESEN